MPNTRAGSRLVGVLLLAALLLGPALAAAPAYAEGSFCTGKGVSLVVDFGKLGGGVEQACAQDGAGRTAAKLFEQAGHQLTPVGEFPGAVCKVDGKPADVNCAKMPPATAYWGLYVKKGPRWDYAPKGADDLKLADGDFVGFAWQSSKKSTPPSVKPVAAPSESASPAAHAQKADAPAEDESSGLPWWVPALVAVVILAAAVGVALSRRRRQ